MSLWESTVLTAIPAFAATAGVWRATGDLGLRRRLDATATFLKIASVANSRPSDGRDTVGTAEQCAAIELLVEFGRSEGHLRAPALAALRETLAAVDGISEVEKRVRSVTEKALARLGT